MGKAMLVCRDVTELVTEYLEGRLSLWTRLRFQLHIGMCRHCRAYLRQMKTTIKMSDQVEPTPPPPDVEAELMDRFKDWIDS